MTYPQRIEDKIGFAPIRAMVAERCLSSLGAERVAEMEFVTDVDTVKSMLFATDEMRHILEGESRLPIDGLLDITPLLRRLTPPGTHPSPTEMLTVRSMLSLINEVSRFFEMSRQATEKEETVEMRSLYPSLEAIAEPLSGHIRPDLMAEIDRVIDRHGQVLDKASETLADIRRHLRSLQGSVSSTMRRVLAKAAAEGIVEAGATPSVRDGRLVIPVLPMYRRRLSGIVHDESASGKTVFIEPAEVVEASNKLRQLEIDENREIVRIMTQLADLLRPSIPALLDASNILGHLDFIRAKAQLAIDTGGNLPVIEDQPALEWYRACHPVLARSLEAHGRSIVPLDITLSEKNRILVISGPNAGGKSVTLKTAGTLQFMLQCGLLPTLSSNSHCGIFDTVMVDIGDDQSLEDDLSTYSSHLRSMKWFLRHAGPSTLMLVDEMGSGTEPTIGGAIAQALLTRLNKAGAWGIVTTHYHNLKQLASSTPGLVNGSMLYDRQLMQPLFRLAVGSPGSSFAIEIARKTGLPADVIDDAAEIAGSDYINLDRYLLDIARDRRYWENKRQAIHDKEKKVDALLDKWETNADTLKTQRRAIIDQARSEARDILDRARATVERTVSDIRRAQADREKTLDARRRLAAEREGLDKPAEAVVSHPLLENKDAGRRRKKAKPVSPPLTPKKQLVEGANVKLDGAGSVGTIQSIDGKRATVIFGNLKTTVNLDRLTPTDARPESGAGKAASFVSTSTDADSRRRQLQFKPDLDLRGMRADEALQALTHFLDDAIQFSTRRVRILHGTGTGALRQAIRSYLKAGVPGIESWRDEDVRLGGAGITVIDLL